MQVIPKKVKGVRTHVRTPFINASQTCKGKVTKKALAIASAFFWCEKRDLNPYGVNHTPLKRARLPVPPLSHATALTATYNIILKKFKMSIPFSKKV